MSQNPEMEQALAELTEWASEDALSQPSKTATTQQKAPSPCLQQNQMRDLFSLLQSVEGCSLPTSMMPEMPR
jgi:hypothetical protein